eukprot:gene4809-3425_t
MRSAASGAWARASGLRRLALRWPRWGWPWLFFVWEAAMFYAVVRANTVVAPGQLMHHW